MSLTQERIRELLDYDPDTGVFTWKHRPALRGKASAWNVRFAGKQAGNVNKSLGYVLIDLDGVPRYAHRLAFIWMTGDAPAMIDHANGAKSDNRWCNIRACSTQQNSFNRPACSNNKTGLKGVVFHKNRAHQNKPYQARLMKKSLGYYATAEDANRAYAREAVRIAGEFARAS